MPTPPNKRSGLYMNIKSTFVQRTLVLVAAALMQGCGKDAIPEPDQTTSDVVPQAYAASTNASIQQVPEFSEATDPSNIGHLFLGQIRAVGYGLDMKVDENIVLLLTGALADEVDGPVTAESIHDAFHQATIVSIENGKGVWDGRMMPAAIATVEISTINRVAGKYGRICMQFGGLKDAEFGYIRSPAYRYCNDQQTGEAGMQEWKKSVQFSATAAYQFSN